MGYWRSSEYGKDGSGWADRTWVFPEAALKRNGNGTNRISADVYDYDLRTYIGRCRIISKNGVDCIMLKGSYVPVEKLPKNAAVNKIKCERPPTLPDCIYRLKKTTGKSEVLIK